MSFKVFALGAIQATASEVTASTSRINWQQGTCTPPDTTYTVSYQLTNRDQCEVLGTDGPETTLDPVTGQSTMIDNLEAFSSYSVSVTGVIPEGETLTIEGEFQTATRGMYKKGPMENRFCSLLFNM